MQRVIYCGIAATVLVALVAAPIHSQGQPQRVRVIPQGGLIGGAQSQSGLVDPNAVAQQRLAQRRQESQQRVAEMQAQMEQMQRQAEENRYNAIRQTLNATDQQWQRIKPQLDRIARLDAEARVNAGPGSAQSSTVSGPGFRGGWGGGGAGMVSGNASAGGGGGFGGTSSFGSSNTPGSSLGGSSAQSSEGRILCDRLMRDVQTPGTPPADIAQRVAALRAIRTQAKEDLAKARADLRKMITPAQEPVLVVMGYLD